MSNIIDDSTTQRTGGIHGRRVRIAYTLNNYQPVLCTLLSDQPYFYMDEDMSIEDDALFDEEQYGAIGAEVAALHKKIEAYDKLSAQFTQSPDTRLHRFIEDAAMIGQAQEIQQFTVEKLIGGLRDSRVASSLFDHAQAYNVAIEFSAQTCDAFYDRDAGKIFIHSGLDESDMMLLAVRELRRHWQHRQGVLLHPLTFHPDQAILINRAQQADLAAAMVRAGWELQLAGHKKVWQRIEHGPLSDLGRAFAREAFVDFRTLNSGMASAAVFETWFLSDRCRHADKRLIQSMLADYQGYMFGSEQVSRTISIDLISALGEMPFGKNYLAAYAQMILSDPVFTEVRDRSNANFLWFIKFERSFRETEQHLQSSGVIHTSSVLAEGTPKDSEDRRNEPQSDVARRRTGQNADAAAIESGSEDSNVIFVPFGRPKTGSVEAVQ